MVAHRLNADRSDTRGAAACGCGAQAVYVDRRAKTFTTALGDVTLERAWYHCAACGHGFSARDRALGLENTSLSPAVRRMVGIAAGETSFGHTSTLLRELAGLEVGAKQAERHAEALGRAIACDELAVVDPEPPRAKTLYVGLDGTGVPVRKAETAGRPGKQADGSAKTREVKLVTVWSAEGRDKHGLPCRDPGSVSCNVAIESIATRDTDRMPSPFAERVGRELERRCVDGAERRVVLGDGAPWIWTSPTSTCPTRSRSSTSFTPSSTSSMSPRPSTAMTPISPHSGASYAATNSTATAPVPSSPRCGSRRPPAMRRGRTSTTSRPIAHAWPTRPSAPGGCASQPASSRAPASPSSATDSSAAVCTGPSTAPTPSSPWMCPPQQPLRRLLGAAGFEILTSHPQIRRAPLAGQSCAS